MRCHCRLLPCMKSLTTSRTNNPSSHRPLPTSLSLPLVPLHLPTNASIITSTPPLNGSTNPPPDLVMPIPPPAQHQHQHLANAAYQTRSPNTNPTQRTTARLTPGINPVLRTGTHKPPDRASNSRKTPPPSICFHLPPRPSHRASHTPPKCDLHRIHSYPHLRPHLRIRSIHPLLGCTIGVGNGEAL